MFYSNRTVINLIKFRLIFIQTKRVSYTQRHSHETLPSLVRARSVKKKRNFFYMLSLFEGFLLTPFFPSRIVLRWQSFGILPIPLPRFATFLSFAHIRKHTRTHTLFPLVFSFHRFSFFSCEFVFDSFRIDLFLADIYTHTHTLTRTCVASYK